MSSYCQDCGMRACNKGICSNCQEELYIMEFQDDDGDYPFSDGFREEAARQRRYLRDREEQP